MTSVVTIYTNHWVSSRPQLEMYFLVGWISESTVELLGKWRLPYFYPCGYGMESMSTPGTSSNAESGHVPYVWELLVKCMNLYIVRLTHK